MVESDVRTRRDQHFPAKAHPPALRQFSRGCPTLQHNTSQASATALVYPTIGRCIVDRAVRLSQPVSLVLIAMTAPHAFQSGENAFQKEMIKVGWVPNAVLASSFA